jgi:signal transduction histidine kinase
VLEIAVEPRFAGDRPESVALALPFCAALAWRRRAPVLCLALGVGVIEAADLTAPALAETAAFLFAFLLALYSTGRYARGRATLAGAMLVGAAIPLAAFETGESVGPEDVGFFAVFFGGPWLAGRVMRRRREREQALEGRAAALAIERDSRAARAVEEERTRIARELHDVVAHAIGVIVLQARGGRRMLAADPGETRAALDAIEHAGEQALAEMRRLLALLRTDEEAPAVEPRPSLQRIDDVVSRVRAAGFAVELHVEGRPVELPPGIDISAYRIVQEGLTNALKHAGPARATVTLRYSPDAVEVEVLDDGTGGSAPNGSGAGHGLLGMRERVAVYGGVLDAGARPEGGYALRARLPLPSGR